MFEHILVPLDFSEKNTLALETAAELAKQGHSKITLLHVIETLEEIPDDELRAFYDKLEERAYRKLDQTKATLERRGIRAETALTLGKRADEIVAYAGDPPVDLIVMSSGRLTPATRAQAWPSISHKVAMLTPLPILLVRPGDAEGRVE